MLAQAERQAGHGHRGRPGRLCSVASATAASATTSMRGQHQDTPTIEVPNSPYIGGSAPSTTTDVGEGQPDRDHQQPPEQVADAHRLIHQASVPDGRGIQGLASAGYR